MDRSAPPRLDPGTVATHRGWLITTTSGPARALHQRPLPEEPTHEIWVHQIERRALVLGSTQADGILDLERARTDGVEVCTRRSGGGVVDLDPGRCCWIDVIIPASSPLWDDDVGKAFNWVGEVWRAALTRSLPASVPRPAITVHDGPLEGGPAGRLVCFASLGPGEVSVDDHKVVGISQRRTKHAARFQTAVQGPWNPGFLRRYLDPTAVTEAALDWHALKVGLPDTWAADPRDLAETFVDCVPAVDGTGGRKASVARRTQGLT